MVLENVLRDYQKYARDKILYAIKSLNRKYILLQSPTGSGKTLMSIAVATEYVKNYDKDVHFAVRTHYQVRQFTKEFVKWLNIVPRILLNKSKSCIRYRGTDITSEDIICKDCPYKPSKEILKDYELELLTTTVSELVRKSYDPYSVNIVLDDGTSTFTLCPYYIFRDISSRYTITTYPYVFNPLLSKLLDKLGNDFGLLVVDESHNLLTLSPFDFKLKITNLSKRVVRSASIMYKYLVKHKVVQEDIAKKRIKILVEIARTLESYFSNINSTEEDIVPFEDILSIYEKYENEIPSLVKDVRTFVQLVEKKVRLSHRRLLYLYTIAKELEKERFYALIYNPQTTELYTKILDYSKITAVLDKYDHVLLMSGTQFTKDFFLQVFKVKPSEVVFIKVPVKIGYKVVKVVTGYTSEYKKRKDIRNIQRLYQIFDKYLPISKPKYLIVFTSSSQMKEHETYFKEKYRGKYIVDEGQPYQRVYEELLSGKDILLTYFGSRLVEGAEFTDSNGRSLIRTIFIVGVPYPVPTKYINELIKINKLDPSMFYNTFASVLVAQAVGRATRHQEDYAIIYLVDNRYKTKVLLRNTLLQFLK